MKSFYENLKTALAGVGIMALVIFAVTLAFGQNIGNQNSQVGSGSGYTIGPLTYGRNIMITTTNDSVGFVVSKPAPANGLTNDFLDFYSGSAPLFTVTGQGAISNMSPAAATNTQINLGIQTFSNAVVAATAYTNWFTNANFPNGYAAPPIVILGHTLTSNQLLTVTTTNYTWTNIAGTAFQTAVAIGAP